jgi:transcriptional regulator with XRE-family HTH domain
VNQKKNLSQGDIEKRTGMLRCYLSRVENGHTVPSIDTLEKWSKALEISLSQLFADNGDPAEPLPALKNHAPKLKRGAANSLRHIEACLARMTPRDIVILTGLARKFAEK